MLAAHASRKPVRGQRERAFAKAYRARHAISRARLRAIRAKPHIDRTGSGSARTCARKLVLPLKVRYVAAEPLLDVRMLPEPG